MGERYSDDSLGGPILPRLSHYDRLGGIPAIRAVVDDFVSNIVADERVNRWFAHAAPDRAPAYKALLVDLLCQGTGGPCRYTGPDLARAHGGHGIPETAFAAVVEDLVAALDTLQVPETEKSELLAILAPMKASIVER